ncbi:MAG: Uma2 family endonuclease [Candidatus Binatia bacterium]
MRRAAATAERTKLMTLEEWAALDEDIEGELVDGVLEEEEVPTVLHELVVTWLTTALRRWTGRRRGFLLGSEAKVAVGPRRGRKPDLSVFLPPVLPAPSHTLVRVPPYLAVEIASPRPRDARRDRVEKPADYARAGVRYYGIVDPQLRSLEVYELGRDGRYTVALTAAQGRVRVPGCRGLTLDLAALWAEVDGAERAHARVTRRR